MRKERKSNNAEDPRLQGIPKKLAKALVEDTEWLDKALQMSKTDIDKEVVRCNEVIVDLTKDMEADGDLASAKERLKEAQAMYKEGLAINKARVTYLILTKRSM